MKMILKIAYKTIQFIRFGLYVLWEIIIANIRVAWHVITPGSLARPGVIAIPLDCTTDVEITCFANIISLTPGTLTLDISRDRKTIYIHAMFIDDIEKLKQSVKYQFEQPILELLKK